MFSVARSRFVILSFLIVFSSLASQASDSLQDLQKFKSLVVANDKQLQQVDRQIQVLNQQINELADKRRFYQIFKTEEEKKLIAIRVEAIKKSADLRASALQMKNQLRSKVSDYISEKNVDYSELRKALTRLEPVAAQGESAVKDLNDALKQLGSSQFASGVNATGSVIDAISGRQRGTLDHVSDALAQAAASQALNAGERALRAAAAFDSQLQELSRGNNSGLLSGSFSGALGRGLIFAVLTGSNPLNSNAFSISNSLFQLSNLAEVKSKVRTALEAIAPVSQGMSQEVSALQAKKTAAEDEFMKGL